MRKMKDKGECAEWMNVNILLGIAGAPDTMESWLWFCSGLLFCSGLRWAVEILIRLSISNTAARAQV